MTGAVPASLLLSVVLGASALPEVGGVDPATKLAGPRLTPPREMPARPAPGRAWGGYLGSIDGRVRVAIERATRRTPALEKAERLLGPPGTLEGPGERGGLADRSHEPGTALPVRLAFGPVSPNPSRGVLTLRFDLPRAATVRFALIDVAGRMVHDFSRRHEAGRHTFDWNVRAIGGRPGVYFLRMSAEGRIVDTRRLVLVF